MKLKSIKLIPNIKRIYSLLKNYFRPPVVKPKIYLPPVNLFQPTSTLFFFNKPKPKICYLNYIQKRYKRQYVHPVKIFKAEILETCSKKGFKLDDYHLIIIKKEYSEGFINAFCQDLKGLKKTYIKFYKQDNIPFLLFVTEADNLVFLHLFTEQNIFPSLLQNIFLYINKTQYLPYIKQHLNNFYPHTFYKVLDIVEKWIKEKARRSYIFWFTAEGARPKLITEKKLIREHWELFMIRYGRPFLHALSVVLGFCTRYPWRWNRNFILKEINPNYYCYEDLRYPFYIKIFNILKYKIERIMDQSFLISTWEEILDQTIRNVPPIEGSLPEPKWEYNIELRLWEVVNPNVEDQTKQILQKIGLNNFIIGSSHFQKTLDKITLK